MVLKYQINSKKQEMEKLMTTLSWRKSLIILFMALLIVGCGSTDTDTKNDNNNPSNLNNDTNHSSGGNNNSNHTSNGNTNTGNVAIDSSKALVFPFGYGTDQGIEPWISDGTENGTKMIKDIKAGRVTSQPLNFKKIGKITYFFAEENQNTALWRTDGTETGTIMLKDNLKLYALQMVEMNGILYFGATDALNDTQLWRSNGTQKGTYKVTNITNGLNISKLITHKGKLYFSASEWSINKGYGLWKSDGTKAVKFNHNKRKELL